MLEPMEVGARTNPTMLCQEVAHNTVVMVGVVTGYVDEELDSCVGAG